MTFNYAHDEIKPRKAQYPTTNLSRYSNQLSKKYQPIHKSEVLFANNVGTEMEVKGS